MNSSKRPNTEKQSHRRSKKCKKDELEESESDSTQASSPNKSINSDNEEENQTAGKIVSIQMVNFMCHENFEIEFDNRVTFITGLNGSGKSSIMTAIIIALGGSAYTTSRGKGLGDFIKKGENWAKIILTLTNGGKKAFKRNVYGDKIIIVRELTLKNGCSYTCKSMKGSIISKKKEEIDKICATMDIQIKNPLCLLNQDVARCLLTNTDAKALFRMFLEATHLDSIKDIYESADTLLKWSQRGVIQKKTEVEETNQKIEQLKKKLDFVISLANTKDRRKALVNELFWSQIIVDENTLHNLSNKKEASQKLLNDFNESRDKVILEIAELKKKITFCEEELDKIQTKRDSGASTKSETIIIQLEKTQGEIIVLKNKIDNLVQKNLRRLEDLNITKKQLQEIKERCHVGTLNKEEMAEKLAELEKELKDVTDQTNNIEIEKSNMLDKRIEYSREFKFIVNELENIKSNKEKLETEMKLMTSGEDNPISMLGPNAVKLEKLVEIAAMNNRFLKKPIGPLCKYVEIKDLKWAKAVESILFGLLETYCCDNQQDFKVLSDLMTKAYAGKNLPIIISKFQDKRHDITNKKVSLSGKNSVLDILNIDDDTTYNTFVDQAKVEKVLLLDTNEEACSLLSNAQGIPKNLRMGLTPNCDQFFPAPNFRTYCGKSNIPLKYFDKKLSKKEKRRKLKENLNLTISMLSTKEVEIKKKEKELKELCEKCTIIEDKFLNLKSRQENLSTEIYRLRRNMVTDNEGSPVRKKALKKELLNLEEIIEQEKKNIDCKKLELEELLKKKNELTRQLKEIQEYEEQISKKKNDLIMECRKYNDIIIAKTAQKSKLDSDIEKATSEYNKWRNDYEAKKSFLENKNKNLAKEAPCERIETRRTPEEIQDLISTCDYELDEGRKFMTNEKLLRKQLKKQYKILESKEIDLKKIEEIVGLLENFTAGRNGEMEIRKVLAKMISYHFRSFLKLRHYKGNLLFDFKEQKLQVEFESGDGSSTTDTSTLSGGERSYLMVSYILSVWGILRTPFCILDEYDVFMDKMNKKVITDLLIWNGGLDKNKQFIFITPQDVSSISLSNIATIIKLPDPRMQVGYD